MENGKKVSFGFSKLSKKTSIVSSQLNKAKVEDIKVEFIDCLEGKSIKLKDPIQPENKILVIPVKNASSSSKKVNEVQTNLTEPQTNSGPISCTEEPPKDAFKNDSLSSFENKSLTLDQIAAKEILEEINKKKDNEESRIFSVPLTSSAPEGEKESTIDDYEDVPVNQFGLAMLRGMGWAPGKGIGKNEKLVSPSLPTLRPKGMGLGADKYVKPQIENPTTSDTLKMSKGSYIRVIAGTHKDNYGQIEGFDDESGRVIVKLALQNIPVSLNEFMIQVVDKKDFTKNSKVINVAKYEKYKNDEEESNFVKDKIVRSSNVLNEFKVDKIESDSESSSKNSKLAKSKKGRSSPPRKMRDKYSGRKSRSRTRSPEERNIKKNSGYRDYHKDKKQSNRISAQRHSSSSSSNSDDASYSRKKIVKASSKSNRSSHRHSSSSSSSSDNISYSRKNKLKEGNKSSYCRRSGRSRSRSPRKDSSYSKHKRSKYR